jgi:prepilin-type processing-associated H-X9-DG protein
MMNSTSFRKDSKETVPTMVSWRVRRAGFTMIEILVVIASVAALMAILLPAVQHSREAARKIQCRNNMRNVAVACLTFHESYTYFPRNTIRPRGVTQINGQPPGNLWEWKSGSFESWYRQIMPFIAHRNVIAQDAVLVMGCPSDPRGPGYKIPTYGFAWYVGVYSNETSDNNGIIVSDSDLNETITASISSVRDGTSNTLMLAERPPPANGHWGWWDSKCCTQDTISPIVGGNDSYGYGIFGECPDPAYYRSGNVQDNCTFNSLSSFHSGGGNFCMADGSVRTIAYDIAHVMCGSTTLLEALASRNGAEVISDF